MPTDRELQAAHAMAQPLPDRSPSALVAAADLQQALRIARRQSLLLAEQRHLVALNDSREFWKTMALALAGDGSYGLTRPEVLAELRDRATREEQQ